ncbi:MAG: hypothetical protein ACYTER_03495 [Planctomycetota bacterium]|jgi:hypothetical protein
MLTELNSADPPIFAGAPCITSDSMSIFFARQTGSEFASTIIFEARIEGPDGTFVHFRARAGLKADAVYFKKRFPEMKKFGFQSIRLCFEIYVSRWLPSWVK